MSWQPKGPAVPRGDASGPHWQPAERRGCPAVLCAVQTHLQHWVLVWALQSKEGYKDGEGSRGQEAWGRYSQTQGLNFGWTCAEPRVEHGDPCGSLPIQDVLWFSDSMIWILSKSVVVSLDARDNSKHWSVFEFTCLSGTWLGSHDMGQTRGLHENLCLTKLSAICQRGTIEAGSEKTFKTSFQAFFFQGLSSYLVFYPVRWEFEEKKGSSYPPG